LQAVYWLAICRKRRALRAYHSTDEYNTTVCVPVYTFYYTTLEEIARRGEMEVADKFTVYNGTKNEKGSKELLL
jgi:hypothetical protein